ncbi:MAG: hypothetical protein Q9190_000593 [Brigantiaea leucoxantha]
MAQSNRKRVALKVAISSTPTDAHTYLANIPLDHCYQQTAHGGLLVSIIVSAVQQHFSKTLAARNQPDTFSISTVFLRPAVAGKAVVNIKDIKLGSTISTVHFTLAQDDKKAVVGYASNTRLDAESGVSFPAPSPLEPEPPPADLKELSDGSDPNWVGYSIPWHPHSFLKAITHFQFFSPLKVPSPKNITDQWICLESEDEKFTTDMLGSVADHWRRMIENYVPKSVWNQDRLPQQVEQVAGRGQVPGYSTSYGYPTLSMQLEVKKALPPEGTRWLFMRARSTEIKNGRFDANITILDEGMEVVALSHQVALVTKSRQIPDTQGPSKDSHI